MSVQAIAKGSKTLPPSSPFAELLRRSKFAAFDPKIRQTYTAPPSYISRGNWGLKRPIANKKRHGNIVLRQFEEHAQYIEWDKASAQVNLVKRVEELNIAPSVVPSTTWSTGLGPSATQMDSEFASQELLEDAKDREAKRLEQQAQTLQEEIESAEGQSPLSFPDPVFNDALMFSLPRRGPGAYGMNSSHAMQTQQEMSDNFVQFNIAAMSPKRFNAYLDELREIRPEFIKYMRAELSKLQDTDDIPDDLLVSQLGKTAVMKCLHRFFLAEYTQKKLQGQTSRTFTEKSRQALANAPQPIQGRPHQQAGLMYAAPTKIETYFTTDYEPGFILQAVANSGHMYTTRDEYLTTFAGLTAVLPKSDAGPGAVPLIEPFSVEGISAELVSDGKGGEKLDPSASERRMRITELSIQNPPVVVGHEAPSKPMKNIQLRSKVVAEGGVSQNMRDNPYTPGSFAYSHYLPKISNRWQPTSPMNSYLTNPDLKNPFDYTRRNHKKDQKTASNTISMLSRLIKPRE